MKNTWKVSEPVSASVSGPMTRNVAVRVGLFFDGTGNNRVNSQIAEDCRATVECMGQEHILECKGRHDDQSSSYGNDVTNIARLAELYFFQPVASNQGHGLNVYWPVYISGVGTTSGRRDSLWPGQSFGRGATGVIAKVAHSIKKLSSRLEQFASYNPGCVINRLELDVFGFSRGAASARHFVNEVLKQDKGLLEAILNRRTVPLSADFSWRNGSVKVKVIGLFDTVAAVGSLRDMGNVRDASNQRVNLYLPPGCAEQVLHLVARDEVRRNFTLNSVMPDWPKEIAMPGTHSDIGGGYHPQMYENVLITQPRWSVIGAEESVESTRAWQESFEELQQMDPDLWFDALDPHASLSVISKERLLNSGTSKPGNKSVMAAVCLRRQVFGHLSRVYLRVMHALASDEGVPFKAVPDSQELMLLPELQHIARKLTACAREGNVRLEAEEERLLRQRYIHNSAHWSALIDSRHKLNEAFFVHAPRQGGRIYHPNLQASGYPR